MSTAYPSGRARARRGVGVLRRWLGRLEGSRGRAVEDGAALAIYIAACLALVGRVAMTDPAGTCACLGTEDPAAYMWGLVWWPHALVHGLNPFVSHVIWTPEGGNVADAPFVPGASLLLAPVTALFGPLVTYNILSLLAPVLAAWFTFRLCRYVTGRWLPSLVGGYVFGFSSYMLAQMLGHLNLILVFLVPAAVHLVLLRLDERVTARRFTVLMTALLTLQFLLSTEVLLTMLLVGGLALILAYLYGSARLRHRIVETVPKILLAGAVTALLMSPYLYYALKGLDENSSRSYANTAAVYSTDPLNYVLPTPVTWVGHGFTESVAAKFNKSNYSESNAYLGLPLIVVTALFLIANRRRTSAKVLLGVLVGVFVASLGAYLHIANPPEGAKYEPSIPLPWLLARQLPAVDHVLPARLPMFVFLVVALILAQWLAQPARRPGGRWLLAGLGVLLLLPNQALPYWRGKPVDPPFFTGGAYKSHLERDETVLVLPYGFNGNSMLWQAETGMYFRMAGGYLTAEVPSDYWEDPILRELLFPGRSGPITPERLGAPLRDFIVRREIGAVIVGPGTAGTWIAVLESLNLRRARVQGVLVYDVPSGFRRLEPTEAGERFKLVERDGTEVLVSPSGEQARVAPGRANGFVEQVISKGSTIELTGWAATREGAADRVVVFAGGDFVAEGRPTQSRPDVAEKLGPAALASGFTIVGITPRATEPTRLRVFGVRRDRAFELDRASNPR